MKILIIDMDRKMAQYESDCLKTFRYDCDISESGQEGLKMAVNNDYCCIILETDLNGALDGFLICSQIRKQKNIIRQALPLQQTHLQIPKRLRYMLSCGRSRQ